MATAEKKAVRDMQSHPVENLGRNSLILSVREVCSVEFPALHRRYLLSLSALLLGLHESCSKQGRKQYYPSITTASSEVCPLLNMFPCTSSLLAVLISSSCPEMIPSQDAIWQETSGCVYHLKSTFAQVTKGVGFQPPNSL